ncbi:hypothetical protein VTP01DRAFT_2259 [Rhizomucor pusillus]|uniref:uncharacterized protein n=1 Tax=Rhizomucor pusillus TaxID=4840 RepID=UPI0037424DD0
MAIAHRAWSRSTTVIVGLIATTIACGVYYRYSWQKHSGIDREDPKDREITEADSARDDPTQEDMKERHVSERLDKVTKQVGVNNVAQDDVGSSNDTPPVEAFTTETSKVKDGSARATLKFEPSTANTVVTKVTDAVFRHDSLMVANKMDSVGDLTGTEAEPSAAVPQDQVEPQILNKVDEIEALSSDDQAIKAPATQEHIQVTSIEAESSAAVPQDQVEPQVLNKADEIETLSSDDQAIKAPATQEHNQVTSIEAKSSAALPQDQVEPQVLNKADEIEARSSDDQAIKAPATQEHTPVAPIQGDAIDGLSKDIATASTNGVIYNAIEKLANHNIAIENGLSKEYISPSNIINNNNNALNETSESSEDDSIDTTDSRSSTAHNIPKHSTLSPFAKEFVPSFSLFTTGAGDTVAAPPKHLKKNKKAIKQQQSHRAVYHSRCKYWPGCTNKHCKFVHPANPCRLGDICKNDRCPYLHPHEM